MPRTVPSDIVRLIDATIPAARTQDEAAQPGNLELDSTWHGPVRAVLNLSDAVPDELITLTNDNLYWYVAARETLRGTLIEWVSGGDRRYLRRLVHVTDNYRLNPVTVVRRMLRQCPDSFPAATARRFAFVADLVLRST